MFQLLFLIAGEEAYQRTGMLMRAECQQEAPYLVLNQNDKRQHIGAADHLRLKAVFPQISCARRADLQQQLAGIVRKKVRVGRTGIQRRIQECCRQLPAV